MKKVGSLNFIFLNLSMALIGITMSTFCFVMAREEFFPVRDTVLRMLILSSVFFIIYLGIIIYNTSIFRKKSFSGEEGEKNYEKIGKFPLHNGLVFIIHFQIYLFFLYIFRRWIGLDTHVEINVFLLCFSWILLAAGGSYVLSDRLNISFLATKNITGFSTNIRRYRQSSKMIIVPSITNVLGILHVFGVLGFLLVKYKELPWVPSEVMIPFVIAFICFLTFIFFLEVVTSNNHKRVFKSVISQLDQLASADKDLSERIKIESGDEVASISNLINKFVTNLGDSMGVIKLVEKELSAFGEELSQNSENSMKDVNDILSNVELMQNHSTQQSVSIQTTSTGVDQISANITGLTEMISSQVASINEASASIEEMVSNIGSINNSMEKIENHFKSLTETSQNGTSIQEETYKKTQEISEKSEDLSVANQVIASIAAQTNLLAMNAAIEAAHAGESGRGFAVVADEIRKLAEHSAKNSKTIGMILSDVREGINSVVDASLQSKEIFDQVAEEISSTDDQVKEIIFSVKEQKEGATQVLQALTQMNQITSEVQNSSSEMKSGNTTILRESGNLKGGNEQMITSIQSVSNGIRCINHSVTSVADIAEKTKQSIDRIRNAVEEFKINHSQPEPESGTA